MALPRKILDLEVEVLAAIIEFVDDSSPWTTAALAQVCKDFKLAVELVKYRRLTIQWDQARQCWVDLKDRPQQQWETREQLRGLRHLTVCKGSLPRSGQQGTADHNDEEAPAFAAVDTSSFDQLQTVLRNASNLKTLVWKVGYLPSTTIIQTLQQHQPSAKLNVYRSRRLTDATEPLDSEKTLAMSPSLNTFSMIASHGTVIEDHMVFQMILALAPNLKFASLVSLPWVRLRDNELSRRRIAPERWFPNAGQPWNANSSIRHLTLDGWSMSAGTLEYWSKYVDLASLGSFKCSRGYLHPTYFQCASRLLTNLKHVSLNFGQLAKDRETAGAIEQYLFHCSPLLSLSLWSGRGMVSLSTILSKHGATLGELHLHDREPDIDDAFYNPRKPLSLEEIRSIRRACPNLKTLTLDLDRYSSQLKVEHYKDVLEELHEFKLEKLQIYLDSGLPWLMTLCRPNLAKLSHFSTDDTRCKKSWSDSPPSPCENNTILESAIAVTTNLNNPELESKTLQPPSSTTNICRFLVDAWKLVFHGTSTGPRQLDLKFGEWESKQPLPFLGLRAEERDFRIWCQARAHERNDKIDQCAIEFHCCEKEKHKRKFTSG